MDGWKIKESKIVFEERFIRVRKDIIEKKGMRTDYVYLDDKIGGSAAVLALTDDGKVPLVAQYRHPQRRICLNLPGGAVEKGEAPEEAARRELREETGIVAEKLVKLAEMNPLQSHHTRVAHLYFARGLRFYAPSPDWGEEVNVVLLEKERLLQMVLQNEIKDVELGFAVLLAHAKGYLS